MVKHIILWTLNPELSEEEKKPVSRQVWKVLWARFPDSST